jgi:hypothetical protein
MLIKQKHCQTPMAYAYNQRQTSGGSLFEDSPQTAHRNSTRHANLENTQYIKGLVDCSSGGTPALGS